MILTKLEMILSFGIFCPLLYPIIIVSLNSYIYFYQYVILNKKWIIKFSNYSNRYQSFPFYFLWFGVFTQQILMFLFLHSDQRNKYSTVLSWIVITVDIIIDILAFWKIKRNSKKQMGK
eukprot:270498_1